MTRLQCLMLSTGLFTTLIVGDGRADMKAPPPARATVRHDTPPSSLSTEYAAIWLKAYRQGARRLLRSKCPFHPSCSAYSQQAIEDHGVCKGIVMTADRLMREADELERVPHRHVPGRGICALDPVSANLLDPHKRRQAQP